jgi:hypothetical protein
MSPFTFCVFALKDDSHQPSMNATLAYPGTETSAETSAESPWLVPRAKQKAKKTKDEGP